MMITEIDDARDMNGIMNNASFFSCNAIEI